MNLPATRILMWFATLVSALAQSGYRVSPDAGTPTALTRDEAMAITFEHARLRQRVIVSLSTPAGLPPQASATIHDAHYRQIDVEEWLIANGLAGAVRFQAFRDGSTEAFATALAHDLTRILVGPMCEIVMGKAWSAPPQGLARPAPA